MVAPEDADFWQLRPFRAFVRGNTEAVKVEETPVPCPKVRKGHRHPLVPRALGKAAQERLDDCLKAP